MPANQHTARRVRPGSRQVPPLRGHGLGAIVRVVLEEGVQLLPAPPGSMVKIRDSNTDTDVAVVHVHCYALVENPKQLPGDRHTHTPVTVGTMQLDAYITDYSFCGHTLASEYYGDETGWYEFVDNPPVRGNLMTIPSGCGMQAEFWNDKNDHSKGTFSNDIRMIRFITDEDGDAQIQPVSFHNEEDNHMDLKPVCEYNNFKGFKT